jgi:hypothetical protein
MGGGGGMKRNLTVMMLILFAVVSYGLYQLSYEVQQLEKDLDTLNRNISNNKESIRILNAEWAYQNRPDVLQAMATKHLPLLLIAPYQVADVDELAEITLSSLENQPQPVPVPRLNPRKDYSEPVELPRGSFRLATFSTSEDMQ